MNRFLLSLLFLSLASCSRRSTEAPQPSPELVVQPTTSPPTDLAPLKVGTSESARTGTDEPAAKDLLAKPVPAAEALLRGKISLVLDPGSHTAHVSRIFLTPDGKLAITVSHDLSVRIRDATTWATRRVVYLASGKFDGIAALSPDGRRLAVPAKHHEKKADGKWGFAYAVHLISLPDGSFERTLHGHKGAIRGLAFSSDGKKLATGGDTDDNATRIWNLEDGNPPKVFSDNRARNVGELAFSPDGTKIVQVRGDHCQIIDARTGKELVAPFTDRGNRSVAWSPDGKTIAVAGFGLGLWEPNGKLRQMIFKEGWVSHVAISGDSQTVLATWDEQHKDGSHTAAAFDLATGKQLVKFAPRGTGADYCAFSPNDRLAVSTGWSGGVNDAFVWNVKTGALVKDLTGSRWIGRVPPMGWSPDGYCVTASNRGDKIPAFDLAELRWRELKNARGAILQIGSLSLKRLSYHTYQVMNDGKPGPKLMIADEGTEATLVGKDKAALFSWAGFVLYDASDGKEIRRFQGADRVESVAPSPDGRYLLGSSADQILRIWSVEKSQPLLHFYAHGKDWIAWTIEGYYAASPGGERLMGWKIDNGSDKAATFSPASRFRASLYRPDVVKLVLEKGSVAKALKAADEATGKSSKPIDLSQVLPPVVALTVAPRDGTAIKDGKLKVEAEATPAGTQPIVSLQLIVDDRPYTGEGGLIVFRPTQPGLVKRAWQIDLAPGAHEIRVLARTEASLGTSRGMVREAEPPSAAPVRKQPNLYILAVGIDAYSAPLTLQGAVNDARDLKKAFEQNSKTIFGKIEVECITDQGAKRDGILKGLDRLKERTTTADVAVFFFAGHGIRDKKGEFYLAPQDVRTGDLESTGLSRPDFKRRMQGLPGRVLVLLDACNSGAIGLLFDDLSRELVDEDCGVVVMCAARPQQSALEKSGHGFFTLSLLEGLKGLGATNKSDGCVYLHHLQSYVVDKVMELSHDQQHPIAVVPPWMRPFALSKPDGPKR